MKSYNVYRHPAHGYEAVKVGFSWPAFFFSWIWMSIKRLWAFAAAYFGLIIVLRVIEAVTDRATSAPGLQAVTYLILAAAYFGIAFIAGSKGNHWRSRGLQNRGYTLVGNNQAETPDASISQAAALAPA